jgi:DNA polymerase III gamma/tau subunit
MVVIDDMDNINEQSQQVFRNYIDKYKNNVHFVSVCTNIQKVIESIQSRVHIINIPPPDKDQLRLIMEKIVKEENIDIDKEAMDYLLMVSNNSIRGLINNLEKMFILNEPIDLPLCKKLCSNISFQIFESYIQYIRKGEIYNAVRVFYEIHDYGYSVIDILDYFFTFIKTTKMVNEEEKYRIIPILCKYITVFHSIHEDVVELALLTNKVFECLFVGDHK